MNDNKVRRFYKAISVHELHPIINNAQINQIERSCENWSKTIDLIAATSGIIEHADGCELLGHNEVVESNHRSYVVNISLKEYFNNEMSEWDAADKAILNPAKRSYREKFLEELENQLNMHNVKNDLNRIEVSFSHNEIEVADELITRIFQVATKKSKE